MPIQDDFALPKLLGYLATEVFQRKPHNPNKPLNQGSHNYYHQVVSDDVKPRLITGTPDIVWGPGGVSDEADGTPASGRWSFTGTWG